MSQHPLADDSLTQLGSPGPLWIYKNNLVTPRAFLASTSSILSNDTAICDELLRKNSPWPAAMFTPNQHASVLSGIHSSFDTVSHLEDKGNDISMQTYSKDSAYLVLTDSYYPGWTAKVDDNEVPVLRCNYAMRAIKIPPGEHNVRFEFKPASYRIGTTISIVTISLMLLGLIVSKQKKDKSL